MPKFELHRAVPYAREGVFDIVADIERYPQFVPGCRSARILRREGECLRVEQGVGAGGWSWRFRTDARLVRPERIEIASRDHPFEHLRQVWRFVEVDAGRTEVTLAVDYELRSPLLRNLVSGLFDEGFRRTLAAFEQRFRACLG